MAARGDRFFLYCGLLIVVLSAVWFLHRHYTRGDTPAAVAQLDEVATTDYGIASTDTQNVLRIAADEWCPVSCDEQAGTGAGYGVDIARAIFTAAGHEVTFSLQPWARAVSETRKGGIDVIIGILVENAPDFIYPQETIGTNTNVFFTRADSHWRYENIASLNSIVVAVANEYAFGEPFDGYVKAHSKDPKHLQILFSQDPVMQGIGLLEAGRVGAYLDDRMVVNWLLGQRRIPLPLREAGQVSAIPLYAAFSPAHPQAKQLAATFDAGIKRMRQSGELAQLLARYGLKDWQ